MLGNSLIFMFLVVTVTKRNEEKKTIQKIQIELK